MSSVRCANSCSEPAGTGASGTHRKPIEPQGFPLQIYFFLSALGEHSVLFDPKLLAGSSSNLHVAFSTV